MFDRKPSNKNLVKNVLGLNRMSVMKPVFELPKFKKQEKHVVEPEDEDVHEPYEILEPKKLKELMEEETLESRDISDLHEGLMPFSEEDYKTSRYAEGLFDKNKVKERRERKKKKRNLLNIKFGNDKQQEEKSDSKKMMPAILTNTGQAVKQGLNKIGKLATQGVEQVNTQVNKVVDTIEKDIKTLTAGEIEEEEEDKAEREDHLGLLRNFKSEVSKVLIQEVTDHYPSFITTSKEIGFVDAELVELGKLWNEMKSSIIAVNELKQVPLKQLVTFDSNSPTPRTSTSNLSDTPSIESTLNTLMMQLQGMMPEYIQSINAHHWARCIQIYHDGDIIVGMKKIYS